MSIQLGATASVKEKSNETEKKMLEERDRAASTKFLVFLYLSKLVNVVKETFILIALLSSRTDHPQKILKW